MKTIQTYLPVFSGFYNTIWESDSEIEREIDYFNEEREKKGLGKVDFDNFEFDYSGYEMQVVKGIAAYLERELSDFVSDIEVEEIRHPKEYNFANDAVNVKIGLSKQNEKNILSYLDKNKVAFEEYLLQYKSCSGFISYYPYDREAFMSDSPLEHKHKLGSILNFIAHNEDSEVELNAYYNVEKYLDVLNYDELMTKDFESDKTK